MNTADFFTRYQDPILSVANNPFGRKYLGIDKEINEKIYRISPNAYTLRTGKNKFTTRFRTYDLFGKKLELAIKSGAVLGLSSFAPQAVPLLALPTSTFFSGAGDGYCEGGAGASSPWDPTHDATSSDGNDDTATTTQIGVDTISTDRYFFKRSFFPFGITAIPAGSFVASGNVQLYATAVNDGDNDGNDYAAIVQTFQASTTALENTDYDDCGSTDGTGGKAMLTPIQEGSAQVDYTGVTTSAYNTFTLNATGIGWVTAAIGATLKIGAREGHDLKDIVINGSTNLTVSTSEASGTTQDPILEVVHFSPRTGLNSKFW